MSGSEGGTRELWGKQNTEKQQRVSFFLSVLALRDSRRRFCPPSVRVAGNFVLSFKTRMFLGFWKAWLNKIENKMHVCIDFNLFKQLVFRRKEKAE